MRLSLAVNVRLMARASIIANGWLGAHLSVSQGVEPSESANQLWLNATNISDDPNTEHSQWEAVALSVGDKVEIEVLADGNLIPRTR